MSNPLRQWRGDRTQDEACKLLGVNAMTYSRWERGEHLPRKTLWPRIQEVTGITPGMLAENMEIDESPVTEAAQ